MVGSLTFTMPTTTEHCPTSWMGLPTRRKILYALLIKKSNEERKVAALAAYVTEQMGYHHGEASLAKTIIGMAQTFVGASNINLLEPEGQFGTRSLGGKDAASARYIFTRLASITRLLFPDVDNETFMDHTVLEHQEEEGKHVEPVHLAPILPLIHQWRTRYWCWMVL